MKKCIRCGLRKPTEAFSRNKASNDGLHPYCKECVREKMREWRAKNPEHNRRYQREWTQKNRVRRAAYRRKHNGEHPHIVAAHRAVSKAVESGKILKVPCEFCGDPNSQAHHEDYAKQLDVWWLCQTHHCERHLRLDETAGGAV